MPLKESTPRNEAPLMVPSSMVTDGPSSNETFRLPSSSGAERTLALRKHTIRENNIMYRERG